MHDRGAVLEGLADALLVLLVVGVAALVVDVGSDQQRAAERAVLDPVAKPFDRRVVPVREPDLQPAPVGQVAERLERSGRDAERLLGEDEVSVAEKSRGQVRGHPGRRGQDVPVRLLVQLADVGERAEVTDGRPASRVGVHPGDELDALVPPEGRQMGLDPDVPQPDQDEPYAPCHARLPIFQRCLLYLV